MKIGIGLPNAIAGATGEQMIEFARRADQAGFSSLGTIDRLVYPNHEPLVTLGAAAGATERIGLATTVLIAPYRANAALLAKQAATLQVLSGGRLSLGVGLGWREDDYETSGVDYRRRGKIVDQQLEEIKRIWSESSDDTKLGPDVSQNPPELIVGGNVDASFRRAARFGDGWMLGGGTPDQFRDGRARLDEAWEEAGRDGKPRATALAYFALGGAGGDDARRSLGHYYAAMGPEGADAVVGSAAKDADTVQAYIEAFEGAGCDELVLFPSSADPEQVDLLAEAAGVGERAAG
jgi:alkanesulfonate monooxygenase SsuD/methylene tetrahydromethanopterin reductase-like flavin-dependent oxidoreductase (luciferase family)